MSAIIPLPKDDVNIRLATMSDLAFIDSLQKKHSKQVGFLHMKTLEGKISLEQVLIAETNGERIGYLIGQDRYFKHDDIGIIYQLVISPGKQRRFIGAALLKAQFDRSAYGCRLYCCWCAQDLAANHFWESMGFYPLAYRNGSETRGKNGKTRVHIFWEKKIRGDDDCCNWWFPHKTDQGAIRADRIALPIPPGVHWADVEAIVIPGAENQLTDQSRGKRVNATKAKPIVNRHPQWGTPGMIDKPPVVETQSKEKPKRIAKPPIDSAQGRKGKLDPKFISAAREFRDRYLEEVNERGFKLESAGKYELTRQIVGGPLPNPLPAYRAREQEAKLLAA